MQILEHLLPDQDIIPYRESEDQYTHPSAWDQEVQEATEEAVAAGQSLDNDGDINPRLFIARHQAAKYKPLRKDGTSCWPQILQVNHQLYDEGRYLIYHNRTFEVFLHSSDIKLCKTSFSSHPNGRILSSVDDYEVFRNQLRPIESLHVTVNMCFTPEPYFHIEYVHRQHMVNNLADCLIRAGNLKRLVLVLRTLWEYNDSAFEQELAHYLRPFEPLRGLESAEIQIDTGRWQNLDIRYETGV
jgi:hypothetical protein